MALWLAWTWVGASLAARAPEDPVAARLSQPLRVAADLADRGDRARWARLRPGAPGADRLKVVVVPDGSIPTTELADEAHWIDPDIEVQVLRDDALQLLVPYATLRELAALPGVQRVREPYYARTKAIESEGVDQMLFIDWHADGNTGADTRVAILDVGFAGWTNVGDDEIPADTVDGTSTGWQTTDHGTAVTEIVHDVAPDAELGIFNFQTDQEYVDLIEQLVNDDWDVINASIGFDNVWHADGTSPYSLTVDWAHGRGVVYVAAAGNEGYNYVSGELTDKLDDQGVAESDGWAEINGNNGIWLPVSGGRGEASFRWTDPMGASSNDFDLYLFHDDQSTTADNLCGASEEPQEGAEDPYEYVSCASDGSWVYARVALTDGGDFPSSREGFLYCYFGIDESVATTARTLTLPADAAGAITIGSYRTTGELAWYSSQGPTEDGRTKPAPTWSPPPR